MKDAVGMPPELTHSSILKGQKALIVGVALVTVIGTLATAGA